MSIFGALGKLAEAVVDTALTPVDATIDAFNLGEPSRTVARLKKIQRDLEEAYEETTEE